MVSDFPVPFAPDSIAHGRIKRVVARPPVQEDYHRNQGKIDKKSIPLWRRRETGHRGLLMR
jgi:hypothetical protein